MIQVCTNLLFLSFMSNLTEKLPIIFKALATPEYRLLIMIALNYWLNKGNTTFSTTFLKIEVTILSILSFQCRMIPSHSLNIFALSPFPFIHFYLPFYLFSKALSWICLFEGDICSIKTKLISPFKIRTTTCLIYVVKLLFSVIFQLFSLY